MSTPNTEIGAITTATLRAMRAKLDEAAAIARAAEGCAADDQPRRALVIALDVEPLAKEVRECAKELRQHRWSRFLAGASWHRARQDWVLAR